MQIKIRQAALNNRQLSPGAILLDGLIATKCQEHESSEVVLSRNDITKILGSSPRQISRYIRDLMKAGLLHTQAQQVGANIYRPLGSPEIGEEREVKPERAIAGQPI
jgi:predicted HTH transcriptional regulator